MGTIRFLFILVVSLFVLEACDNDDQIVLPKKETKVWNLKNVSGGFLGLDIDYDKADIIWEFIPSDSNLIVTNSTLIKEPQSLYIPLESGTYKYETKEVKGDSFIYIDGFGTYDNGEYGSYEENDELIINQNKGSEYSGSDFYTLIFEK